MKHIKKIAVIGGTGKSGQYVVRELLKNNFQCKLLLRHPENFSLAHPLIEIIAGDARNPGSIAELLKDCQAVISTLGQPKGESSIFSQATRNIVASMHHYLIQRYIATTGLSVDAPGDLKGTDSVAATEWMKSNYPETTSDKQVEYDVLSASKVNWTLVRLPLIEQTEEIRAISINLDDCAGAKISAASLAHFLVGLLSDDTYIRKAPFIADV